MPLEVTRKAPLPSPLPPRSGGPAAVPALGLARPGPLPPRSLARRFWPVWCAPPCSLRTTSHGADGRMRTWDTTPETATPTPLPSAARSPSRSLNYLVRSGADVCEAANASRPTPRRSAGLRAEVRGSISARKVKLHVWTRTLPQWHDWDTRLLVH